MGKKKKVEFNLQKARYFKFGPDRDTMEGYFLGVSSFSGGYFADYNFLTTKGIVKVQGHANLVDKMDRVPLETVQGCLFRIRLNKKLLTESGAVEMRFRVDYDPENRILLI